MDKRGNLLINLDFEFIRPFSERLALFEENNKYV
ncbi:MAG: WG repeat-containing protein [Cytophagaceae bacterium]|nr:WG repeat-containing protein [Cytophagaceae bacterium]